MRHLPLNRRLTLAAFLGAGITTGLAGLSSSLWLLAWVGIGLLALALAGAQGRGTAALGITITVVVSKIIWLHWSFAMAEALLGEDVLLVGVGFILVEALPGLSLLMIGALLWHGRPWVRLWLPL